MIKINDVYWELRFVAPYSPDLQRSDGTFSVGCCNRNNQTIYISADLRGKELKKVLCHEIVHAAMFSYDVFLDLYTEELFADLVATYGEEIINITNYLFNELKKEGYY